MSQYRFDLTGWTTMYATVDFAFSLNFSNLETRKDSDRLHVRIQGAFSFKNGSQAFNLDPEEAPTELGPALQTCRTAPRQFLVDDDGALTLKFDNDISIVVQPLEHYEAWTANGPGESVLVCTPGGHVAKFDRVEGTPLKLPTSEWPPPARPTD